MFDKIKNFRSNNVQVLENGDNDDDDDDDTNQGGNKKENIKRLSSPKKGNAILQLLA